MVKILLTRWKSLRRAPQCTTTPQAGGTVIHVLQGRASRSMSSLLPPSFAVLTQQLSRGGGRQEMQQSYYKEEGERALAPGVKVLDEAGAHCAV